ncbi:MAG TPA: hypothetical protein PK106_08675, partial [Bacteroidales bacterium]|nr:hypothetical protein [Bacteroidales bacterium]
MIKDDPDGTVREEQNEAEINASGTDDTIKNETSEAARAFERLEDGWDEDKKEIEAEQIKEEVEVVVEPRVSDDVKNEGAVDEEPAQDTKEGEVKSETEPEGTTETETGSATDIEPEIAPEAEGRKSDTSDYEDMKLPPVDYSRF